MDAYQPPMLQNKGKLRFIRSFDNALSHAIFCFKININFMAHLEDDLWKPKLIRLFRLNNGRSFERVSIQSSEVMINAIHMYGGLSLSFKISEKKHIQIKSNLK